MLAPPLMLEHILQTFLLFSYPPILTLFLLPVFSHIRTESSILSLYLEIRIRQNLYPGIFYVLNIACIKWKVLFSECWSAELWVEIFCFQCTKNHFFFFQMFRKDGLSKKNRTGIWSFLYYQKRWYFFFPKIDKKGKMIFLKKTRGNMFSSNLMVFAKKSHKNMNIFVTSGKMVFLFSLDGKWNYLSAKKKQRQIHLKVTFAASLKKMIFILENMVFLLKYHVDWPSRLTF